MTSSRPQRPLPRPPASVKGVSRHGSHCHSRAPSSIRSINHITMNAVTTGSSAQNYNLLEVKCHHCGKRGHIIPKCPHLQQTTPKAVHSSELNQEDGYDHDDRGESQDLAGIDQVDYIPQKIEEKQLLVRSLGSDDSTSKDGKSFRIQVELRNDEDEKISELKALIDTGSEATLIESRYVELLSPVIYPLDLYLSGACTGMKLECIGFIYAAIRVGNISKGKTIKIYVIDSLRSPMLLGDDFIRTFCMNIMMFPNEKKVISFYKMDTPP